MWALWWEGQHVLSHGTNLSAGVAIFFCPSSKAKALQTEEVAKGRLVVVRVEIKGVQFSFVNVYAPNVGHDRVVFFNALHIALSWCANGGFIVIGGDWNCTVDSTIDFTS